MSRAFVTDKEDWIYCAKAGERCLHAESGKDCGKTDCEFYNKQVREAGGSSNALRIVARKSKKTDDKGSSSKEAQPRKTKKAAIPKPRKWGGRSDFSPPKDWKKY